jgi:hypothetical protein
MPREMNEQRNGENYTLSIFVVSSILCIIITEVEVAGHKWECNIKMYLAKYIVFKLNFTD